MIPSPKDFFISYNQRDRSWAEWLAWTLEEAGYSVIIDAWDFRPGGNFALEMDKAAKQTHKTIAVLSEYYLKAEYVHPEWAAALAKDPTGKNRSLLTIRVSPCEPKGLLGSITRLDIFELDEMQAQVAVLDALKKRAKPDQKPQFPGAIPIPKRKPALRDKPIPKRKPFPVTPIENQNVDLTAMFQETFHPKLAQWSNRQQALLQAVQTEIQQRLHLEDVFNDNLLIPLSMLEQPKQVDRSPLKPRRKLEPPDGTTMFASQSMLEVFLQAHCKLLILGDPGAGKTTTLLTLAKELVAGAIATPETVLPIIFELSTWRDDSQSLKAWLLAQLYENFGGDRKRKIYEPWLEKQVLLPLLDGLDELGMERQKLCTEKINEFARTYPQLVVCCRVREFRQAGVKLSDLRGAVCLQPLGDEQIRRYLLNVGQGELWEALETQPEMRTMLEDGEDGKPGILRVPLLLSIAAMAYEGRSFGSKAELFEAYIERRLSGDVRKAGRNLRGVKCKEWAYKALELEPEQEKTQHYLHWLAEKLNENSQTELLLEQMQPEWLDTRGQKWQYQLIVRLIVGLIAGLIAGLISGLIVGLAFGLISGLISGLDEIQFVEAFRLSMSREARREMTRGLQQGLIVGLSLGLIAGLVSGLISGLIVGLISGLSFGLNFGLIVGSKQDFEVRARPNQGIWNSFQSMIWTTLLAYPGSITLVYFSGTIANGLSEGQNWHMITETLLKNLPHDLILGASGALFLGFCYGGGVPFIQHFCLRFILTCHHSAPWRYVRFLNYCVERRLLQRVGGRYRFLHRELLEYFAQRS